MKGDRWVNWPRQNLGEVGETEARKGMITDSCYKASDSFYLVLQTFHNIKLYSSTLNVFLLLFVHLLMSI